METLFLLFLLLPLSKKPSTKSKQRKSLVNKGQTAKKLQNNSDRLLFLTHFVLQKRGPAGLDQKPDQTPKPDQDQGRGPVTRPAAPKPPLLRKCCLVTASAKARRSARMRSQSKPATPKETTTRLLPVLPPDPAALLWGLATALPGEGR